MWMKTTRRLMQPIPIGSSDQNGRNHEISVPAGTPLTLLLSAPQVNVSEASGKAVTTASDTRLNFVHPGQGQIYQVNFAISKKP